MDNGTGFTKMGYAGNLTPAFDIPTLICDVPNTGPAALINSNRKTNATLDFFIGRGHHYWSFRPCQECGFAARHGEMRI